MMLRILHLVGLALLAACSSPSQPAGEGAPVTVGEGDKAPGFQLPASDGTSISLEQFRGRPVLLYFSMGPG
jgi:cytochrome oxidase Cu insertion factor (SCO1/SenC/PrrC family)